MYFVCFQFCSFLLLLIFPFHFISVSCSFSFFPPFGLCPCVSSSLFHFCSSSSLFYFFYVSLLVFYSSFLPLAILGSYLSFSFRYVPLKFSFPAFLLPLKPFLNSFFSLSSFVFLRTRILVYFFSRPLWFFLLS